MFSPAKRLTMVEAGTILKLDISGYGIMQMVEKMTEKGAEILQAEYRRLQLLVEDGKVFYGLEE